MALVDSVRSKLDGLFNRLGSTITITPLNSAVVDKWGDSTPTYGTATTTLSVPYNYLAKELSYQPFGDLRDGQVDIVVPYTATVTEKSKVTYDSNDYFVLGIEKFVITGSTIAQLLRLQKSI